MDNILDTLITNRTLDDVQQRTAKGAYNASDMNRVERATGYLADLMLALPNELRTIAESLDVDWTPFYDVTYDLEELRLVTRTDWGITEIPTGPDSDRYLGNILALCHGLQCVATDLPTSLDKLSYKNANDIEGCLKRAEKAFEELRQNTRKRLEATARAWPYAGEIFSGEVTG